MERNVKQVIETDNLTNLIVRVNNKTAKLTKIAGGGGGGANRRVYIGGGFNVVFYGMTVFKFLPYPFKTDIDDCASHPCKNTGNCTDRVNGFNCSCAPGFNGTQCEAGSSSCK